MSMEQNLNKFLEELIQEVEKELDEATATGNVAGYNVPGAFSNGGAKDKKRKKKISTQFGMKIVGKVDEDSVNESIITEKQLKGLDGIDSKTHLKKISDKQKLKIIQGNGNIISFKVPKGSSRNFWQVIVKGKIKKTRNLQGYVRYIVPGKMINSPFFKSEKDLINGVDWDSVEQTRRFNESVKEATFRPNSGTMSGGTYGLDKRKYELKRDVKGVQIGDYTNVTLPKGTIIYNLPGGVFAHHRSLKSYEGGQNKYFNKSTFRGISIRREKNVILSIEKNSKILESVNEASIKGRNNKTGESFGMVIGSDKKNKEGEFEVTIRISYSSRISSYKFMFDKGSNLIAIKDYGYSMDGKFPDMKGGGSVKSIRPNPRETITQIAKITSPAFAKKIVQHVKKVNESVNEGKTISSSKISMMGARVLNKISIGTIFDTEDGKYEITDYGRQANAFKEFEAEHNGKKVKVKLTAMYGVELEVTDDVRSSRFNKKVKLNSIILESINEVGVNVWYFYKKANKNKNKFFKMLSDFRKKHSDTAWIKMLNYALEDFNENPKKYKTIDDKQNILFKNLQNNKKVYEGMMSTIDQIRQDSKDVRDFVKNVFKDREFKKMSNDKDFIKYLKSIYEGVDESAKVKSLEEKINLFVEKNVPTNPSKWSYYKSQAKKKFDVYPSAYANGWAAKKYKAAGGGWKKEK